MSGSIALRPLNDTHAELVLTPGHQAVFLKSDRSTRVRPVDTRAVTSWHDGRFSFEELTLQQIMTTLSRWYNFDFRFADERLADALDAWVSADGGQGDAGVGSDAPESGDITGADGDDVGATASAAETGGAFARSGSDIIAVVVTVIVLAGAGAGVWLGRRRVRR